MARKSSFTGFGWNTAFFFGCGAAALRCSSSALSIFNAAAHTMNDRAVAKAYGFDPDSPTSAVLSRLFVLYTKATEQLKNQPPPRDRESPRWHGGGRPRR